MMIQSQIEELYDDSFTHNHCEKQPNRRLLFQYTTLFFYRCIGCIKYSIQHYLTFLLLLVSGS